MKIPKCIHQVWIGPLPAPATWMKTWRKRNPRWEYVLWDNEKVFSRPWQNQWIIDEYVRRAEEVAQTGTFVSAKGRVFTGEKATLFAWHVIADVIRYEILYEYGGYMPGADSVCLKPIPYYSLFAGHSLYTVNTGHLYEAKWEFAEGPLARRYHPLNASPVLAAAKRHPFLKHCIDELGKLTLADLKEAVDTTGNVFMGKMLETYPIPDANIPPYVTRKTRLRNGYHSVHYAGTTKNRYHLGR